MRDVEREKQLIDMRQRQMQFEQERARLQAAAQPLTPWNLPNQGVAAAVPGASVASAVHASAHSANSAIFGLGHQLSGYELLFRLETVRQQKSAEFPMALRRLQPNVFQWVISKRPEWLQQLQGRWPGN